MAWYEIFGIQHQTKTEPTIVDRLNEHLGGMTQDEGVEALKAIVKEVCPQAHVSKNPPKGKTRKPKVTP